LCPVLGRAGGAGVGTPPAGASAPGRRLRCLRPLREQAARAWSHLHVQEQFALMVTETVADSRGLSLTVMVWGSSKTSCGAGWRERARERPEQRCCDYRDLN
jgi:hypothetical protein